jgi:hypothetical protein
MDLFSLCKATLVAAAAVLSVSGSVPARAANMLGDTLSFERLYPDLSTPYGPPFSPSSTVVAAGPSDAVSWTASGVATIDPEANSLIFDLFGDTSYGGQAPGVFDGYRISGFGRDIQSATVAAYGGPLAIAVGFGNGPSGRYLTVNLEGHIGSSNDVFSVDVTLVPEPSVAAMMLAGLAAVGLAARPRRKPRG